MTLSSSLFERISTGKASLAASTLASAFALLEGLSGNHELAHLSTGASAMLAAYSLFALTRYERANARVLGKIANVCSEISKGNFEARVVRIEEPGMLGEAQHRLNDMIDRSDAFVREATASLAAVCRNVYYRRIFLEGLDGAFRTAAEVINHSVEAQAAIEQQRVASVAEQLRIIDLLGSALKSLADGDLAFRLVDFPETYMRLQQDFNAAASQLEDALSSIIGGANTICSTTREIANAANDLAHRTEQSAAGLEETTAAIQEISNSVDTTVLGARHASETVSTAKSDAEKSGEIVRCAIEAIGRIEKSSQAIAQIIGVIDEIAFQTNLLALNAGVEAARAGESGRGFAVVAAEVRSLAQRSAEAAKEIRNLISTSSSEVQDGVKRVTEAGQALERIAVQVTQINRTIGEIAAGASNESSAIHQISIAIGQMDHDTQKNAAMVEETTAATHSLLQETERLLGSVQNFKVRQDEAQPNVGSRPQKKTSLERPLKTVRLPASGAAVQKAEIEQSGWEEF